MNWRQGLFRIWVIGSAIWVLLIAFLAYQQATGVVLIEGLRPCPPTPAGLTDWICINMPRDILVRQARGLAVAEVFLWVGAALTPPVVILVATRWVARGFKSAA
jgi:hypothetical protein